MPERGPTTLEERPRGEDARVSSPSAARNRDPILAVLRAQALTRGKVLEVGSGTGEHAVHLAGALPELDWLPSDPDPEARASIAAWIGAAGVPNVRPPRDVDARRERWGVEDDAPFDLMVSINMIHVAPWATALGLLRGAGCLLRRGGALFLYGPFREGGVHTAPSNTAFDASLRARDPAWGVRDLDDLAREARANDLLLDAVVAMPANNRSLVFRRV